MIAAQAIGERATLRRDNDTLLFGGALLRDDIATLWPQATQQLSGVLRFDLRAVERIDSAGLALLSQLASLGDGEIAIEGKPAGLAELSAAYRLLPSLAFAS